MSEMKIAGVIGTKNRIYVSYYVKEVENHRNRKIFETFPDK
jgi:hypothetical protein